MANDVAVNRWSGVQRRVRAIAPRRLRRADLRAFRLVAENEIPVVGRWLPRLSRAADHSLLWLVVAGLLAGTGRPPQRRAAVRGVLAIGLTSALVNLPAKLLTGRTRPDRTIVPAVRQLARVPMSTSFPSGHSASAFAFATAVSLEEPRAGGPLFALAGAVAFSRVYIGVHYPLDVLVGAAIGTGVATATVRSWPPPVTATARTRPLVTSGPPPAPDGHGLVLVANLGAGSPLGGDPAGRLQRELPAARVLRAEPDEGLEHLLHRAAAQARVLGVAGGDGTAGTAAGVAHAAGIPLAVVPAGTLNHLAHDLGIDDADGVIAAVRHGRCAEMDLAEVGDQPFVNALGVGLYPDVIDQRQRLEDHLGKWPAAVWCALRCLLRRRPYEIEIDGRRRRVWTLFVGNGTYDGDGPAPTRRRELADGWFDVRLLHAETTWSRVRALSGALTGWRTCRTYERWRARQVGLRSTDGELRIACDGESLTAPSSVTVRKRPGPLLVMAPAGGAAGS